MWINFDQLLDLPNVTVVNYQKIEQTIFLKLALLNETIECPNCHQILDRINQTEYNLVRDLSILGNRVYLEVPRRPPAPPTSGGLPLARAPHLNKQFKFAGSLSFYVC
jgi:hypothetical protein